MLKQNKYSVLLNRKHDTVLLEFSGVSAPLFRIAAEPHVYMYPCVFMFLVGTLQRS